MPAKAKTRFCRAVRRSVLPLWILGGLANAQQRPDFVRFIDTENPWVDSVFRSLAPKERIAQLFLVRAHSNLGQGYIDSVGRMIEKQQLGGVVLFQGGPMRHAQMLNRYQKLVKVPLLVAFDGEWGLGMRLRDSTVSYPYQMTLGAVQDDRLLYEMGRQVAKDFRRMGMHFNFAPVVDVNNNPKNPVINFRSFGDDRNNVVRKAKAYMEGMVDGGLIASLKHFPGHGDTDVDSHHDLPQLSFSKKRLDSLEIFPFRELIRAGAPSVMSGHMHIPALDATPNMPSSISRKVVTGLLRNELGFRGLAVTDAMDMKGVTKFFPGGEADIMAIEAGNDLLELSQNSARAIDLVEKAIQSGRLDQADIDARVKRVLAAKYWAGLHDYRPVDTENLIADLNSPAARSLAQRLADAAITVLKPENEPIPFDKNAQTAIVSIGTDRFGDFENGLSALLTEKEAFLITGKETKTQLNAMLRAIRRNEQVVLAIHDGRPRPGSEVKWNENLRKFVGMLTDRPTLTVLFTNAYAVPSLPVHRSNSIVLAYQNDGFMQKAALKALSGTIEPKGRLPVVLPQPL